jgi:hypothetical protein
MRIPPAGPDCGVEGGGEDVPVDPPDYRHANGVAEAEEVLCSLAYEREISSALESTVLPRRHPAHPQTALVCYDENLLATPASRRAKTPGQAVEPDFGAAMPVPNSTEDGADMHPTAS